jgi:hypothetical protein
MESKDVKHGIHVTINSERVWEVLDRKTNIVWWLHRWNEAGEYETTYNTPANMTLVSNGARQESILELELV